MRRAVFCLGLCISLSIVAFSQVRTVTNMDLEKYRIERVMAEKDLRENYAKMGFPSPEEMQRQREADMAMRIELIDKLRQARLDEERIDIDRARVALDAARLQAEIDAQNQESEASQYNSYPNTGVYGYPGTYGYPGVYGYPGGYGYPGYGGRYGNGRGYYDRWGRWHDRFRIGVYGNPGGYRVTPGGVYPTRSYPRPYFTQPR